MHDLSKIIVALDLPSVDAALKIVDELGDDISYYKVGPVLFIQDGPNFIRELKRRGKKVFLDMKFHDIPNTIGGACYQAYQHKVDMLTINLGAGLATAEKALETLEMSEIKIIGVTALTSLGKEDLKDLGVTLSMNNFVLSLTGVAIKAKLHGIVCSPHETKSIRKFIQDFSLKSALAEKHFKEMVKNFLIINPGIRLESDEKNDQNRSATPKFAFEAGADYIVIGRPITQAMDKKAKIEELKRHLNS